MWYPPLIIGIFFAPESPWWLIRKGKIGEARKSLMRLTSTKSNPDYNPDETIDMIRHTTELEQDITAGASYLDCFRGNLTGSRTVAELTDQAPISGGPRLYVQFGPPRT